tara:strand:- start:2043 stop:2360 length:318 start_codon:yes stop_codon:yes gene_type:complete
VSSSYQDWVGGRPETGSGTNYHFEFIAPENDSLFKIQSIKAHNRYLDFNLNPLKFNKGDSLKVFAYKNKKVWNSDTVCKITYKIRKKKYILVPNDLKKLDRLLYP